jgi:hypothetical protein
LLLTALILFLFANRKRIVPAYPPVVGLFLMFAATVFSLGIQWYALGHLPFVDCLPFKKGNNIDEQRKPPKNAIPDLYETKIILEKNGKKSEFKSFPDDWKSYKYDTTITKLVRKGNMEPAIKGFSLISAGGIDSTDFILGAAKAVILFSESFSLAAPGWQKNFKPVYEKANQDHIPVYFITASAQEASQILKNTEFASVPVFSCDFTAIRTAARTNPTVYFLKNGKIEGKWSYKDMSKASRILSL